MLQSNDQSLSSLIELDVSKDTETRKNSVFGSVVVVVAGVQHNAGWTLPPVVFSCNAWWNDAIMREKKTCLPVVVFFRFFRCSTTRNTNSNERIE
jgi:hypothetical protein